MRVVIVILFRSKKQCSGGCWVEHSWSPSIVATKSDHLPAATLPHILATENNNTTLYYYAVAGVSKQHHVHWEDCWEGEWQSMREHYKCNKMFLCKLLGKSKKRLWFDGMAGIGKRSTNTKNNKRKRKHAKLPPSSLLLCQCISMKCGARNKSSCKCQKLDWEGIGDTTPTYFSHS